MFAVIAIPFVFKIFLLYKRIVFFVFLPDNFTDKINVCFNGLLHIFQIHFFYTDVFLNKQRYLFLNATRINTGIQLCNNFSITGRGRQFISSSSIQLYILMRNYL